jgi:hypothetical protein
MVFRYQQTGKKPEKVEAGEQYSEIGFYHEPTQWEPKSGAVADYAEKDGDFPKIDRINISSTGDLHESTANHHEVRAKRFELYVNCDKDPRNDEKPFGDQNGDDSFLYAGDAHIRAGNRIVIKADEEIRLQVGRSAIVISDKGISIVSKKTKSNIATPWDTALSVTPLEGISMFGTHLKMVAAYDFLLAESFGGSLSSMLGVTRITSKDFKALSSTLVSYVVTGAGVMGTIADVIGSTLAGAVIGTGKHGVSKGSENASVNGLPAKLSLAPELLAFALNINCGFLDADCKDDHDPLYSLLIIQRIAATVLKIVAMVIEMFTPKKNMDEYGGKDGLIATVTIAESGLLIAGFAMIIKNLLTMPATAGHTSYLHLSGNACAALGGFELELMGTRTKHAAGPAAGLAFIMSGYGGMAWDILKKHWGKILIALGVVGSAAAVSFGVAAGVAKDGLMDFVTVAADERAKAQLKEL